MTQPQRTASDPKHSVWVSASAGTGKTKVLTDRVLRLLLDDVPIQKILCLTFTTAAAAEMATRIQTRLGEWVTLPEAKLKEELETLTGIAPTPALITRVRTLFAEILDAEEGLRIQTIHSFCQSLIQRFPLEAGVTPYSQVIDEATAKELLEEAKLRLLRGSYPTQDYRAEEAMRAISWRVAESSFAELVEEIVGNSNKFIYMFQHHNIDELADIIYDTLGAAPHITPEMIIEKTCLDGSFDSEGLKQLSHAWLNGSKAEAERGQKLANWLIKSHNERMGGYADYCSVFLTKEGKTFAKSLLNKATLERYPATEMVLQHEASRLHTAEEHRKSQHCTIFSLHILHIAEALLAIYSDLKKQKGFLDYNDLIHIGTTLISDTEASAWILYKLDGGIDHILVDEAQDTSPAQWDIVTALSAEFFSGDNANTTSRSLFVVGDEKQSIYSFQGADPRKFHAMQEEFSNRAAQAMQSWQTIPLDLSFRSTESVLRAVDTVFAPPELRQAISPSQPVQHEAHRKGHAGIVEIWPAFKLEAEEEMQPWPLPNQRQANVTSASMLAEHIADTIAGWLQSKRLLASQNRPITPGDIMILVRSRNDFVHDVVRALKKRHIPVSGTDRMALLNHIAIMDLVALGHFLLLPQDDLTLATVLKTPLIGLSEEALFTLAHRRSGTLWDNLKQKQDDPTFNNAYNYLSSLLGSVDNSTPFALFNEILETKQGRKAFIQRMGHEVNDPLDEFISLALTYERSFTPSLQGFLHWLETSQVVIKRDMEQGIDQVRIMTIHASKGLQAPIVFLPDNMQLPKQKEKLIWAGGLAFWTGGKKYENDICDALRDAHKTATLQEYYRLLYVAMTRPEDELYICGYQGKNKPPEQCWHSEVSKALEPIAEKTPHALRLASPQEAPARIARKVTTNNQAIPIPAHFLTPAPKEIQPHFFAASHYQENTSPVSEQQRHAMLRGTIIHRLLEFLPNLPPERRIINATSFLQHYRHDFTTGAFTQLLQDVTQLLENPDYAFLFTSHSQAEVPVIGTVNGQKLAGQIDRLVIENDRVWIIDYKTMPHPPKGKEDIPPAYLNQLALYKALISPAFPGKTIHCALLWTATLRWDVL